MHIELGMLPYERATTFDDTIAVLKDPKKWEYYDKSDTSIDSTGARMTAYIKLLRTSQVLQCIQQKGSLEDNILRNSQGDQTAAELISLLMNYKDVGQAVYSRTRSNKSPDSTTVGLTVLQWIAAGIIDAYVKENSEGKKEVYIRAGCDDEAMFHFNDNSWWEKILTVS